MQCVGLALFVSTDTYLVYVVACAIYGSGPNCLPVMDIAADSSSVPTGFGGVGAVLPLVAMDTFGHGRFGRVYGSIGFYNVIPAIGILRVKFMNLIRAT